ncbi:MAG: hypothetical protein RBQ91_00440 [Acholeplasma sp.]|nr:hypothetical protein [Acholeplasma sp.]
MLKERDEVFKKLIDLIEHADTQTKLMVYEELLETGSVILTFFDIEASHIFSISNFVHKEVSFSETIENDIFIGNRFSENDLEVLEVSEDAED